MKIEILGTESLGVRGLSCVVETGQRKLVFDPGLALGYLRHKLLPHPLQIAVGKVVRRRIVEALRDCTDVVFSHFHGDHIPLADPNPFQLPASEISMFLRKSQIWCKSPHNDSAAMAKRRSDLSRVLHRRLSDSEGVTDGPLAFSTAVPHGEAGGHLGTVMMTRVEDAEAVFVHASDIQLLDDAPIQQILAWKPDIVFASGPPLYLRHLSGLKRHQARKNALRLSENISTLILDHHLLRDDVGFRFLDDLSNSSVHRIICAADYMQRRRLPLEAWRQRLYQEIPVPENWHEAYLQGKAHTDNY